MDEKTLEQRVGELEAELKAAKEEAAAKENAAKPYVPKEPWKRFDPTAAMGMPWSAVKAMVDVFRTPKGLGFNPHAWAQNRPGVPGGFGSPPGSPPEKRPERVDELEIEKPKRSYWQHDR